MSLPISGSSSTSGAGEPAGPAGGEQAPGLRGRSRQTVPSAQLRGLAARTRREAGDDARAMSDLFGTIFDYQAPSAGAEPRSTQAAEALRLNTLASALPALPLELRPATAKHLLQEILKIRPQHRTGPLSALVTAGLIDEPAAKIDDLLDMLSGLTPPDQSVVLGALASAGAARQAFKETDGPASRAGAAQEAALPRFVEKLFDGSQDGRTSQRRRVAAPQTQRLIDDLLDMSSKYDVEHLRRQPLRLDRASIEPIVDALPRLDLQDQHALLNILVPRSFKVIGQRKMAELIGVTVDLIPHRQKEGANRLLADLVGNDVPVFELVNSVDRWPLARRIFHLVQKEQPENPELLCAFAENVALRVPPSGQVDFWWRIQEFANKSTEQYRDIVLPFIDDLKMRNTRRR
jgi:hypothetical protein